MIVFAIESQEENERQKGETKLRHKIEIVAAANGRIGFSRMSPFLETKAIPDQFRTPHK
jgi:hypothetical protein